MVRVKTKGTYGPIEKKLELYSSRGALTDDMLEYFANRGLLALMESTPVKTGNVASSWYYEITKKGNKYTISWNNSVMAGFVPVVILIDQGHATKTGGYINGKYFIKKAMDPVFKEISDYFGREV